MRKFNFKKGATLYRFGFYTVNFDDGGELLLPLRTNKATFKDEIISNIMKGQKIPTKVVAPSPKEIEELKNSGFEIPKGLVQVNRIDEESKRYKDFIAKQARYGKFLNVVLYIDLLFKFDDGKMLWEHLGLKSESDYVGMCEFLDEIGMDEGMINRISEHIAVVKVMGASNYKEAEEKMSATDVYFSKLESLESDEEETE